MSFLKDPRFWKFAAFMIVLAVALWIWTVDTDDVRDAALFVDEGDIKEIEVTSGVRAAFYAMVAAAFVLVSLIPTDRKLSENSPFSLLVQAMGGGAAGMAGWLWLSSETGDMPLPYIMPMVILGLVVGIVIAIQVLWIAIDDLRRLRKESKD